MVFQRYQQYMASNTVCYNLDNFVDKSSPQGNYYQCDKTVCQFYLLTAQAAQF